MTSPSRSAGAKVLEQYFYDLYGVFMKMLSTFVLEPATSDADIVKMEAMLREMVKIKKMLAKSVKKAK